MILAVGLLRGISAPLLKPPGTTQTPLPRYSRTLVGLLRGISIPTRTPVAPSPALACLIRGTVSVAWTVQPDDGVHPAIRVDVPNREATVITN